MGKRRDALPRLPVDGQRVQGIVRRGFTAKEGYGFIMVHGHADVFVHMEQVQKIGLSGLRTDDPVSFIVRPDRIQPTRTLAMQLEVAADRRARSEEVGLPKAPSGKSAGMIVRIFTHTNTGLLDP